MRLHEDMLWFDVYTIAASGEERGLRIQAYTSTRLVNEGSASSMHTRASKDVICIWTTIFFNKFHLRLEQYSRSAFVDSRYLSAS